MKNYILLKLFLVLNTINIFSQTTYPCTVNGNAESNNYSSWERRTNTSGNPQDFNNFILSADPQRFGIHSSLSNYNNSIAGPMLVNGVDKYGGFSVPSEGAYCFSIGNNAVGSQAEMMKYTFVVTNENKNFKFRYAVVLEDGAHSGIDNPSVNFYMVKGTNYKIQYPRDVTIMNLTSREFIADVNDPFFKVSTYNSNVVFKNWECIEYDLSAFLGQTLTFVAYARDCPQGAHFGYMYLDGLCTNWPAIANMTISSNSICLEQPLTLNGATSVGEDSYYVEVLEVDNNNFAIPNGLDVHNWFIAQQAPNNFDVRTFITDGGEQLECGKRYKVKLAVWNHCSQWNETSNYFNVTCPSLNIGPDIVKCCGNSLVELFTLNATKKGALSYSWNSYPSGYSGNTPYFNFNSPNQNTAFIASVTMSNGCVVRDTLLYYRLPSEYSITLNQTYTLCELNSKVKANLNIIGCPSNTQSFYNQFGSPENNLMNWFFKPTVPAGSTWQFIGTGQTITAPNQDGTLEVRLTTPCTQVEIKKSIPIYERPQGSGLICANSFTPDNGNANNVFRIFEYGPMAPMLVGEGPAYGISDFQLKIWNRWGNIIRTVSKDDIGRAPNDYLRQGDIYWDGKSDSGANAQDGAYTFQLWIKPCGQSNFVLSQAPTGAGLTNCIHWNIFGNCVGTLPGSEWGAQIILIR
jgi:hypothetical protein